MGQRKAQQWIHVLGAVLQATRRTLGDAPSRSLAESAQRLGVAEAEAAAVVVPTEEPPPPADPPLPPLWPGWHRMAPWAPPGSDGAAARGSRQENMPYGETRAADQ